MDVFVIGGGPAGLAAAIAVRQRGLEVTVADGAQPPIDKACGEGLLPDSMAALRDLGIVFDPAERRILRGIRFVDATHRVEARFPSESGIGVRRPILHQKMVERAAALGIKLLWKTPVTHIDRHEVRAGSQTIAARWIIGADGIRSRVRQWIGLGTNSRAQLRCASRLHYHIEPWSDYMEVYWGNRAQAYVTPVDAQRVCVVVISRDAEVRRLSLAEEFPELAERLAGAAHAYRERGAITATRRLHQVSRGNVALIGDASGSVDAITGEGLSLSFRQAAALADALEAHDLRLYELAHRRLARRPSRMAHLLLTLDRHAALRHRTMRALAAHPETFARLLSAHIGESSPAHLVKTGMLLGLRLLVA